MKSCINSIIFVIILASIPILIYSIKSKKNIFKNILIIDIMYIIYLFIGVFYLPNVLVLDKGLEVLFIYLISNNILESIKTTNEPINLNIITPR